MPYSNEWLLAKMAAGLEPKFSYFWGHTPAAERVDKSCLSQWFAAGFTAGGRYFATAEHWMMYHKAITFGDTETANRILAETEPKKVKAWGRKVRGFLPEKWDEVKFDIVVAGNVLKFGQHALLGDYLRSTAPSILVEASPYDAQWGIGLRAEDAIRLNDPAKWEGLNLLGWALMEARDKLATPV